MKLATFRKHVKKLKEEGWSVELPNGYLFRLFPPEGKDRELMNAEDIGIYNKSNETKIKRGECCPITAVCWEKKGHYWYYDGDTKAAAEDIGIEFENQEIIEDAADFPLGDLEQMKFSGKEAINLRKWLFKTFEVEDKYL